MHPRGRSFCLPPTVCLHISDNLGWPTAFTLSSDGECFAIEPGYFFYEEVRVQVPYGVEAGVRDSIFVMMRYCDVNMMCNEDCHDIEECEDPNYYEIWDGTVQGPFFSGDTVILIVE